MTPALTQATALDVLAPEADRKQLHRKLAQALTVTAALGAVAASLAGSKSRLSVNTLIEGVAEQFHELLKIPISEITQRAWNHSREVVQAIQETEDSGDLAFVPLLEYSFTSVHHPRIEVMVGNTAVQTLEFTIELEIRLEGIRIQIKAGRVVGAMAAQIEAKGTAKFGEYVLAEKDFQPVPVL